MPLNLIQESSGSPFIRYAVSEDEWTRSSETGELEEVEMKGASVVIDIEQIHMGWLKLSDGRDWVAWPDNDPTKANKPSDAYSQGGLILFYSTKLFGDAPIREFCSSSKGVVRWFEKLYAAAEASENWGKDKVPVVKMGKGTSIKIGKGNSRDIAFEITGWKDRSEIFGSGAENTSPSESAAPETKLSGSGASDDVKFGEI